MTPPIHSTMAMQLLVSIWSQTHQYRLCPSRSFKDSWLYSRSWDTATNRALMWQKFAKQLPSGKTKFPIHLQQHSCLLVPQAKGRAIQIPDSYFRFIKTQRNIMLTNHTGNPQQKNHTQQPHTCTHVIPPTAQFNTRRALQTEKAEVAPSKGAAGIQSWTELYELQGQTRGLPAQFSHMLLNINTLIVNIMWCGSLQICSSCSWKECNLPIYQK